MNLLRALKKAVSEDASIGAALSGIRLFQSEWQSSQLCQHCWQYMDPDVFLLMIACARLPVRQLRKLSISPEMELHQSAGPSVERPSRAGFLGKYQMSTNEEDVVAKLLLQKALCGLKVTLLQLRHRMPLAELSLAGLTGNATIYEEVNRDTTTMQHTTMQQSMDNSCGLSEEIWPLSMPSTPVAITGLWHDPDATSRLQQASLQHMVSEAIIECQFMVRMIKL